MHTRTHVHTHYEKLKTILIIFSFYAKAFYLLFFSLRFTHNSFSSFIHSSFHPHLSHLFVSFFSPFSFFFIVLCILAIQAQKQCWFNFLMHTMLQKMECKFTFYKNMKKKLPSKNFLLFYVKKNDRRFLNF